MAQVTLSKERHYVTADRTRAVKPGDPDAAFLLVGKGGAIAPEVAAHYGIETYTGESVQRIVEHPGDQTEQDRMVSKGTSSTTAANYEEMRINRDVRESVNAAITKEDNRSAGRQAEIMATGIVNTLKAEGGFPGSETKAAAEAPAETATRTKEIAPPGGSSPEPPLKPDAGGETPSGQAPAQPLEGELELEDAKDKTL